MIFVTVGNDFRRFDRLLEKMDEMAPRLPDRVVMQRGISHYRAKNVTCFDFVPLDQAIEYIQNARLVISHAGIGTIILCKQYGIPLLILPRKKAYGEHMNDHQLEIARALESKEENHIHVVYEEGQLEQNILKILQEEKPYPPCENKEKAALIKTIRAFLHEA